MPTVSATGTGVATETISSGAAFPRSFIYQSTAYNPFPITTETITADKWFNPLAEPVRVKRFPTSEQQALAFQYPFPSAPIGAVSTYLEGPPTSVRLLQYQSVAFPVPVFETVTVDKWFAPLTDPVRTRRLPTAEQQAFTAPSAVIVPMVQHSWTEPVRARRLPTSEQQAFVGSPFTPEVITVDKWFEPLAEPTRRKPSEARQPTAQAPFIEDAAILTKWFEPWSDPTRRKVSQARQPTAWSTFTPAAETITEDKWHQAWSEPVRLRQFPTAEQRAYFAPEATIPAVTAVATATQTPSVLFPRSIIYQSVAWSPYPITAPTFTYFSMVQGDTGLTFEKTVVYQISAEAPVEDIFPDKWCRPLSEPVRKRTLAAAQQQAFTWSGFTPAAETIFEDKWHQAWSEPVKVRQFPTSEQRAYFAPEATLPRAEATIATAQMPSVIFPRNIIYQSVAWSPYPIAAEVIYEDKWHQGWSEPVRTKRFATSEQQAWAGPVFVQPIFPGSWYEPLSEPIRQRIFQTKLQVSFAWGYFTPTAEVITEDKWHQPWSEPVRRKGLPAHEQQTFAFWPQPIITFGYYNWLSDPVRLKKGLRKDLQQTVAEPPQYPNLFRIIPWFKPLEEPVRQKRGLRAWLQQFFTAGTEPIANVVTVVIDATETNNDTAQFYAVVYNRPVRCYISIKEVPRGDDAYASFEET